MLKGGCKRLVSDPLRLFGIVKQPVDLETQTVRMLTNKQTNQNYTFANLPKPEVRSSYSAQQPGPEGVLPLAEQFCEVDKDHRRVPGILEDTPEGSEWNRVHRCRAFPEAQLHH